MTKRLLIVVIVMLAIISTGCNDMKFNQTTEKNELITKKYSATMAEDLKSKAEEGVPFSEFKRDFDVQCARKTHQGFYVVLLLKDGRNAYAFFNKNSILTEVIISDGFRSKSEFLNLVIGQTTESEVLKFDTNAIFTPVSAIEVTAHITQKGVCIVKYSRFKGNELTDDPIVTSIDFFENDKIATSDDPIIRDLIPFILEIDKRK